MASKTPYRTLPRAAPTMGVRGERASEAGNALDEQRFTHQASRHESAERERAEHGAGATLELH